ncbi:MAG: phosphoenolpyruvate--protein phosphotransferase [Lachnospiraceae bacterium]|nr:phosphoenolpyruvate--protein phosphotransferase [Lachnospiraceae bacterium]
MKEARGISVLNRIAIGRIHYYHPSKREVDESPAEDVEAELKGFEDARQKAIDEQNGLYEKALREAGEEEAAVFEVHAMMLEDDDLIGDINRYIREGKRAAYAVDMACKEQAQVFSEMDDSYMRERAADILDIGRSVIDIILGLKGSELQGAEASILMAEDLAPSETVKLKKELLLGFVTKEGSGNSHTAILARSMGIPALVQCGEVDPEWDGHLAIIDGYNGCLYLDPEEGQLAEFKARQAEEERKRKELDAYKGVESITKSGRRVQVYANIGSPKDLDAVLQNDAEGIGLFRSEFLYLNRDDYPDEETQYLAYREVLKALYPREVIIRTCDIGADKTVDYMGLDKEENPALGFRAIRISLSRRDFFKTQLRALLRASIYGRLGIMFPMIISLKELLSCKELLRECEEELRLKGAEISDSIEVGTMIETPAAVLIADELAEHCDFFSIGTNDLTQYTCAVDRQNAALDDFLDIHHPAVLKEIRMTVEAGHRHSCRVGICGELGADLSLIGQFIDWGVDELSVSPVKVLPIRKAICNHG